MMMLAQLFFSFVKIGFCSFGGLTMVPIINDEVLAHGWMTADEVMDIVAVAEMTPGSLGVNCATFVGLRSAGIAGAVLATAGVMVPSLTLCLLAAIFFIRLKGNTVMERILRGVRPVSLGMLPAVALSLGQSSFLGAGGIAWDLIAIAILCGYLLVKKNLSIPKTILLAAVLGLVI